jgi:hypothetical protein
MSMSFLDSHPSKCLRKVFFELKVLIWSFGHLMIDDFLFYLNYFCNFLLFCLTPVLESCTTLCLAAALHLET